MSILCKAYKVQIIFCLFTFFSLELYAQHELPPSVRTLITTAFKQASPEKISEYLVKEIPKLSSVQEKKKGLLFLSDYEQRVGLYTASFHHYIEADKIQPESDHVQILLNAIRVALLSNDQWYIQKAIELINELTTQVHTPLTESDCRILVYRAWLQVSSDQKEGIQAIKDYVTRVEFSNWHASLLFTLWWVDNDKNAENTLLKKYPKSIEAAVIRNEVLLSPSLFWYLMPRNIVMSKSMEIKSTESSSMIQEKNKASKSVVSKKGPATSPIKIPKFRQVGFFKTKEYAQILFNELQKKGFSPVLKNEKRSSEITYYSVAVPENSAGNVDLQLKDAGYESTPLFE